MSSFKAVLIQGLKLIVLLTLLLSFLGCLTVINILNEALSDLPSWQRQHFEQLASPSTIYDTQGQLLTRLRGKTYRIPIKLDTIPQDMQDAMVATEDERFYDHKGIDYWGLGRALLTDLKGGSSQEGASTITQQLVKNVLLSPEKRIARKIKEAYISRKVEQTYSKREILELYLNYIYFGEGAYGIEAASRVYFGKSAKDLSLVECATLAGLAKNPNRFSPFANPTDAKNRRNTVLRVMCRNGYISEAEAQGASQIALPTERFVPEDDYPYPYFLDHVISELVNKYGFTEEQVYGGGLQIYTTLDQKVQQSIEVVYADPNNFPPGKVDQNPESAMVVIEQSTGRIKGLIGGRKHVIRRGYNRATMLRRQPGSTFKPLVVYAPAIEKGYGPATLLDSSVESYGPDTDAYTPENMGSISWGKISMRMALNNSVNTYAVKLLKLIGVNEGYNFGKRLGLNSLISQDKALGLALGGTTQGLSPLELAAAYAPLANRGKRVTPCAVTKVLDTKGNTLLEPNPQPEQVMKAETADMLTDLLVSAVEDGTGKLAKLPNQPTAGKTGTTQLPFLEKDKQGNKDAWFAGYTPELVGVVWLGYDNTDPEHYLYKVYGGSYPAIIWNKVFSSIIVGVRPSTFTPPPTNLVFAERRQYTNKSTPKKTAPTQPSLPVVPEVPGKSGSEPPAVKSEGGIIDKFISLFH
jgi:penicillin-binding protein 1A